MLFCLFFWFILLSSIEETLPVQKVTFVLFFIKYQLTSLHDFCADCCGCGKEFKNEQSLVALDKHWHLGCFKCKVCNKVLNAEYISK